MQEIQKQQLSDLEPDTHYKVCTFYLDEETWYESKNNKFSQCSFRGKTQFILDEHNPFSDCGFSHLSVDLQEMDKIPTYIFH